jgi:hypothetical protein
MEQKEGARDASVKRITNTTCSTGRCYLQSSLPHKVTLLALSLPIVLFSLIVGTYALNGDSSTQGLSVSSNKRNSFFVVLFQNFNK